MLALTWAGIEYAWVSPQVLVPLVVGAVGLLTFFAVEYLRRQEQTVRLPRFSCMHLPYLTSDTQILLHKPHYVQRVCEFLFCYEY